jgi:hypothetical protein
LRTTLGRLTAITTLIAAASAAESQAQTRLTSIEELRRALGHGDLVTVVPTAGQPVVGRLSELGPADLTLREVGRDRRAAQDFNIPFEAIRMLERRPDPVRNGVAIGAGIGAAAGGAMFGYALAVDRNEVDEWGPAYAAIAAASIGIGALVGWIVDRARSKPHIRYQAASG